MFVAFVVVATVGLTEVTLRVVYREPWYQRLVREQSAGERFGYNTNSRGLRDVEVPDNRSPEAEPGEPSASSGQQEGGSVRRVLFLGDSFTFGSGVKDDAAPFPRGVERKLNNVGPDDGRRLRPPGVARIEVLNGGIPGSYPAHWLELLTEIVDVYRPHAIVAVFFLRDGTRMSAINHFFGPIRDEIVLRNANSLLYRSSYIVRVLRDRRDRQLVGESYTRALHRGYFGNDTQTAHWTRTQNDLEQIFSVAKERSIPLGLVAFPVLAQLAEESYPFERIGDRVLRFGRSHRVPTYNLLDDFRGHDGPELWISALDQHPNADAHAIAAEGLALFTAGLVWRAEGLELSRR